MIKRNKNKKINSNENAEMVLNNNKQIKHHTDELPNAIKGKNVPAWVVAKVNRSASDLSDVTHYMDGQGEKFETGGALNNDMCIQKVVDMVSRMKDVDDYYIVDRKLVIILKEELRLYDLDILNYHLSEIEGCSNVIDNEFEIGYGEEYKTLILSLKTDDFTKHKFKKGGDTSDLSDATHNMEGQNNKYRRGGFLYEIEKRGEKLDIKDRIFSANNIPELKKKLIEKYGSLEGISASRKMPSGAYAYVKLESGGMLSNKLKMINIEFDDQTDRRHGMYSFCFETIDNEGASVLDYSGYIIERPIEDRRDDEIEWDNNVPEDWEKAEDILINAFYNWKRNKYANGGGVSVWETIDGEIVKEISKFNGIESILLFSGHFVEVKDSKIIGSDYLKVPNYVVDKINKDLNRNIKYDEGKYAKGGGVDSEIRGGIRYVKGKDLEWSEIMSFDIADYGEEEAEKMAYKFVQQYIKYWNGELNENDFLVKKSRNGKDFKGSWVVMRQIPKYAKGGEIEINDSNSLRYFLLNHASDGMIANKIPYSDYKTIDAIRLTALQILNRDGDREYSVKSFSDLIQEALLEYEENKYEGKFAKGGGVGEDKLELFYVMDNNGNVKNISKSYEKANEFLEKSLKFNGNIGYKNVPKSDWYAEKINVSNIKNYAKGGGVGKIKVGSKIGFLRPKTGRYEWAEVLSIDGENVNLVVRHPKRRQWDNYFTETKSRITEFINTESDDWKDGRQLMKIKYAKGGGVGENRSDRNENNTIFSINAEFDETKNFNVQLYIKSLKIEPDKVKIIDKYGMLYINNLDALEASILAQKLENNKNFFNINIENS